MQTDRAEQFALDWQKEKINQLPESPMVLAISSAPGGAEKCVLQNG